MLLSLLLVVLAQEPAVKPTGGAAAAVPVAPPGAAGAPAVAVQPPPPPTDAAQAQYAQAYGLLSRGDYGNATVILNALAQTQPRWAAVFASRCVAQARLGYPQNAVEDCRYALSLDPTSASALWWLAESEAALGQRAQAAAHFRQYAASASPDVSPGHRAQAQKRAEELENPVLQARPTTPPPAPERPAPAIQVVVPAVAHEVLREASSRASDCSSSRDCGHGRWCKDRGDGVKACMGEGGAGAFCSNSNDCGHGLWCKERGDGVNVCMGQGAFNDYCRSGNDCGPGLWCRDRGDGTKACRK